MKDKSSIPDNLLSIADPIQQSPHPTPETGFFSKIFKGDKVIWSVFIILTIISLIEVFSSTSTIVYRQQNHWGPILRHATFLLGGVGVILFMHNVPYKYFSSFIFVLFASVILLLLTPFLGETINGADRWIKIMGISIQPSEIAKISLMGTIAFLLSRQNNKNEKNLFKWMIGLMLGVSFIIAIDNLSTAMLLFFVCFVLMFIGNVKIMRLVKVALLGLAGIVIIILLLKIIPTPSSEKGVLKRLATWQSRIDEFSSSNGIEDEGSYYQITDKNFQVAHSKIAIANGGVFGKFPGNSKERDFLPQAYSDFIYSIILEEMGLLGGTVVLILYIIILMRAGKIAQKTDKLFPKYLILGSALMLAMQAFVNMAVAVNLIPVTGQPLPLISRGGTSTLITCAYFGIILSADRFGKCKKKTEVSSTANVEVINIDYMEQESDEESKEEEAIEKSVVHEEYSSGIEFEVIKA